MGGGVLYNFSSHLLNLLFPKKTKLKILSSEQYYLKNKRIKELKQMTIKQIKYVVLL